MLVSQGCDAAFAGVLGLLIGSFLNVVIYRTPVMTYRDWLAEPSPISCLEGRALAVVAEPSARGRAPRGAGSSCRQGGRRHRSAASFQPDRCRARAAEHCGHEIRWYENVPVLSYVVLRGRCSSCKTSISPRYPVVELVTGALFALCAWRFGVTPAGALWCRLRRRC